MEECFNAVYQLFGKPEYLLSFLVSFISYVAPEKYLLILLHPLINGFPELRTFVCAEFCRVQIFFLVLPTAFVNLEKPFFFLVVLLVATFSPLLPVAVFFFSSFAASLYLAVERSSCKLLVLLVYFGILTLVYERIIPLDICQRPAVVDVECATMGG